MLEKSPRFARSASFCPIRGSGASFCPIGKSGASLSDQEIGHIFLSDLEIGLYTSPLEIGRLFLSDREIGTSFVRSGDRTVHLSSGDWPSPYQMPKLRDFQAANPWFGLNRENRYRIFLCQQTRGNYDIEKLLVSPADVSNSYRKYTPGDSGNPGHSEHSDPLFLLAKLELNSRSFGRFPSRSIF